MKAVKEMIFSNENMPTPNCHASTVLPLEDGSVLAAWFGGLREGCGDVNIRFSKRTSSGWSEPGCVSAFGTIPHWNPVLFLRRDGKICLFFKVGRHIPSWRTFVSISDDGGETFGKPHELVPGDRSGGRGPVKNKILRLSDGRLLAPASSEKKGWSAFVDMSFDDGETWHKQETVKTRQIAPILNSENGYTKNAVAMIQPTLWESENGSVHMFTRTSAGFIYRSDSPDCGKTWCRAYQTELLNNNSGIDIAKAADGGLYLVSNPVGENWGDRSPLTLMRSYDNGMSFETVMTLEDNPGGEYSYPAIVASGNKLYITYTYDRLQIAYWSIEL